MEKDEIIPKEWLERMDHYQHKLTADIKWDVGDVLVIDVSKRRKFHHGRVYIVLIIVFNQLQNYAAQHARWGWEGERKILASFWDQPGIWGKPVAPTA